MENISDTLVSFGSEIKALGETADAYKFGGYLVVFDTHDASNLKDKFTAATDFDIENGDRRSVYYNHGLDGTIKRTRLGSATLQIKDAGVWIEGEIKKRSDYLKTHAEKIADGIKNGVFGLSSGAPAHLVEREKCSGGHEVKMWPIAEASITPTPAEPMTTCVSLKSLMTVEEIEGTDELKAVTTADTLPYPQQLPDIVDYPTRQPVLTGEESDYARCAACSAHNAPDATKCAECGALIPESGRKSVEVKKDGDWITINGAHIQIGGDKHKEIFGGGGKAPEPSSGDNHVTQAAVEKMSVKEAKAKLKELKTAHKAHKEKMKASDRSDSGYRAASGDWRHDVAKGMAFSEAIGRLENHILVDPITGARRDATKTIGEQLDDDDFELKKYDPRQPRDDMGRWSNGSGGISIGHALHVAKHEGIAEEHHAGIEEGIRSGKFATREAVLAHIDAIHGKQGTSGPKPKSSVPSKITSSHIETAIEQALTENPKGHTTSESDFDNGIHMAVASRLDYQVGTDEIKPVLQKMADEGRVNLQKNGIVKLPSTASTPAAAPVGGSSGAAPKAAHEMTSAEFGVPEAPKPVVVNSLPHLERVARENPERLDEAGKQALAKLKEQRKQHSKYLRQHKQYLEKANQHFYAVQRAVSAGERVPSHVLAEYNMGPRKSLEGWEIEEIKTLLEIPLDDTDDTHETKHLSSLESSLLAGVDFTSHSAAVLAAVEEFVERSDGLKTVRCERDGRRWSAEKYQSLTQTAAGLYDAAEAIKAMAEAHAPKAVSAANDDALKALAQIELTRARLNGIALP